MTETAGLALVHEGPLVRLVLDRADKANALTQQMWEAIPELISRAESLPGARVLSLESTTPAVFCAGADVGEYKRNAGSVEWGMANHIRVTGATDSLHQCRLLTVAVVAGPCAGGGVGLISACDLRLADATAIFSVPPTRLGLVYPQADTARLVDLVGASATKWLLLTAAKVDAQWALSHGLADEVVGPANLPAALDAVVSRVVAGAPVSVRAMKRTIELALEGQRSENDETRALLGEALTHPDHHEGTAAFLERRSPDFGLETD